MYRCSFVTTKTRICQSRIYVSLFKHGGASGYSNTTTDAYMR